MLNESLKSDLDFDLPSNKVSMGLNNVHVGWPFDSWNKVRHNKETDESDAVNLYLFCVCDSHHGTVCSNIMFQH